MQCPFWRLRYALLIWVFHLCGLLHPTLLRWRSSDTRSQSDKERSFCPKTSHTSDAGRTTVLKSLAFNAADSFNCMMAIQYLAFEEITHDVSLPVDIFQRGFEEIPSPQSSLVIASRLPVATYLYWRLDFLTGIGHRKVTPTFVFIILPVYENSLKICIPVAHRPIFVYHRPYRFGSCSQKSWELLLSSSVASLLCNPRLEGTSFCTEINGIEFETQLGFLSCWRSYRATSKKPTGNLWPYNPFTW